MIDKIKLMIRLMDQSTRLFIAYKESNIHSRNVISYREETDFDYISLLCSGVCSQLKAGKDFNEIDVGGLLHFKDFNFIDSVLYGKFFLDAEHKDVGYFLGCLCVSQILLDIIRSDVISLADSID